MSADFIRAISELIAALVWPLIIIIVLLIYRKSVRNILVNLEEISLPGGFAAKIRREAQRAARRAVEEEGRVEEPTEGELEVAERIGTAALDHDLSVIRQQVSRFASEYERVRSTMPGGPERTRRMQAVVSKLRTLAVAARPMLAELSRSRSVGERLAAVVILQVRPETDWVAWLGEVGSEDMTFVGHQAVVSLLTASRIFRDHEVRVRIQQEVDRIKEALERDTRKHRREMVLGRIEQELQQEE